MRNFTLMAALIAATTLVTGCSAESIADFRADVSEGLADLAKNVAPVADPAVATTAAPAPSAKPAGKKAAEPAAVGTPAAATVIVMPTTGTGGIGCPKKPSSTLGRVLNGIGDIAAFVPTKIMEATGWENPCE